jgi:hypothetical protein
MLRASCESNDIDIDMRVVVDPEKPCNVPHYAELIAFADALLAQDERSLAERREALRDLVGDAGVCRAAAVVGTFQLMNRALDTLGATFGDRLPSRVKQMAADFGITPPPHWIT